MSNNKIYQFKRLILLIKLKLRLLTLSHCKIKTIKITIKTNNKNIHLLKYLNTNKIIRFDNSLIIVI